jgi:hypothetical protein
MKRALLPIALVVAAICLNSPVSVGQTQNTLSRLVGTVWRTEPIVYPNTQGLLVVYIFQFSKNGKVGRTTFINRAPGVQFNPFTNNLDMTTGITGVSGLAGSYKLNGNSIRLDFSEDSQSGTIANDRMWGVVETKSGNLNFEAKKTLTYTDEWRELRASDLIGTWEGVFDQAQYACTLEIERAEGNASYGTLKPKGGRIAVTGAIDLATRQITFIETRVISLGGNQAWTLGRNQGFISNSGRYISGVGVGGLIYYNWNFTKK